MILKTAQDHIVGRWIALWIRLKHAFPYKN
jgi:hypothetical protein